MSDFVQPPSTERTNRLPGFDPLDSPLSPGGRPDPFGRQLAGASPRLRGILDFPSTPHPRLAVYKVRREGWVARRAAARERYREIHSKGPSSAERILGELVARGGILDDARAGAARSRFNLRGTP